METQQKILLIDDEPDILEFLSYNFRKHQFNVIIADNGMKGVEMAKSEAPDVIVSDILMPEMNGIEMCKAIRTESAIASTPFIFLTALTDDYKILHAMLSGADEFVTKPIRFDYLFAIVKRVVAEKKNLYY